MPRVSTQHLCSSELHSRYNTINRRVLALQLTHVDSVLRVVGEGGVEDIAVDRVVGCPYAPTDAVCTVTRTGDRARIGNENI